MSMDVQRQIRENTLELNEFLKDLKGWEHTVKEKEKKILNQAVAKDKKNLGTGIPRRKLSSGSELNGNSVQGISSNIAELRKTPAKDTSGQSEGEKQGGVSSKPGKMPASHTYENFQKKWDKFDVDAALKEVDSEDDDDGPVKKVSKREILPPRRSLPKTGTDNTSDGHREGTSVRRSLPPGKVVGGEALPMAGADELSGSFGFDDSPPDAASEKDLGNEYFKEGKYVRAIDCYSRSLALQPTAVAYANRAMAAIKIRRFEDAEFDCSEAISLDDRYTKAYARRGTARKELKKYLAAVEDFEFALRLEPGNKELKKQYTEVEDLYQKEGGGKVIKQDTPVIVKEKEEIISPKLQLNLEKSTPAFVDQSQNLLVPPKVSTEAGSKARPMEPVDSELLSAKRKPIELPDALRRQPSESGLPPPSAKNSIPDTGSNVGCAQKQAKVRDRKMAEVVAATQAAAARAAASAMAAVSKNIVAPRSSFEFELMWKGLGGNKDSQVRLLKVMDPLSLPKVFKDSLGAPLLLEIIQSLELLFPEDAELAVQILENLTKVGRFNMTVMFLTSKDKTGLRQLWAQVFMNSPPDLQTKLQDLRTAYRLV